MRHPVFHSRPESTPTRAASVPAFPTVMTDPERRQRRFLPTARLVLVTVVLGLASRRFGGVLPVFVAQYAGDVLWATMVFWLCALVRPRATTVALSVAALLIAVGVECSQLIRLPWLDALRATTLGALVLGQGFLWSDLARYAVGVVLAMGIDLLLGRAKGGRTRAG